MGRLDRANPGLYQLLSSDDQVMCLVRGKWNNLKHWLIGG